VTWPSPVTTSLEAWQFGPCSVMQFESVEVQPVLSPKLCLPIDLGLGYSHLAWGWVRLPQTGGSGGGLATPKRPNNFILFYFYFFTIPNPNHILKMKKHNVLCYGNDNDTKCWG